MVQGFVGRTTQRALLRELLSSPGPALIFVHGPGGIGKSALLAAFADDARRAGATPYLVDVTDGRPTMDQLQQVLGHRTGRALYLVDDCADPRGLGRWLQRHWSSELPDDAVVVIASRADPGLDLCGATGVPPRVRSVALSELDGSDAAAFARLAVDEPDLAQRVVSLAAGNPLALRILSAVASTDPGRLPNRSLGENISCVRQLLDGIVEPLPSARHRRALQVCAHLRFTTEHLLARCVPGDVHELFDWLRRQPYVTEESRGLVPSPIVRSIVEADLRWRDPHGCSQLHRDLIAALTTSTAPADRQSTFWHALDALQLAAVASGVQWSIRAQPSIQLRSAGDTTVEAEVRDDDGAMLAHATRTTFSQQSLEGSADEVAALLSVHIDQYGRAREGETIALTRVISDAHHSALPYVLAWLGLASQSEPTATWEAVAVGPAAQSVSPHALTVLGFSRVDGVLPDGSELFAHDWRMADFPGLLQQLTEPSWGAPARGARTVLGEVEFGAAVRRAMRDLGSDPALAANPLLDSRLVRTGDPAAEPVQRLRALIRGQATALRAEHAELFHLLERTYLRPAMTQEQLAAALGLPFTTYRRRRDRAVELVAAALWARERGVEHG